MRAPVAGGDFAVVESDLDPGRSRADETCAAFDPRLELRFERSVSNDVAELGRDLLPEQRQVRNAAASAHLDLAP